MTAASRWPGALLALALAVVALTCARSTPRPRPAPPPTDIGADGEQRSETAPPPRPVSANMPAALRSAPPVAIAAPPPPAPRFTAPRLLRVGLATDLPSLTLPCCDGEVVAETGGRTVAVVSTLLVEPAAGAARGGGFRLQVVALKDQGQAERLASDLRRRSGQPADVVFDAGTDLYRVRVGRFRTREEAETEQRRLAGLGIPQSWVVSEPGELLDPALRVTQSGRSVRVPGRWLEVRPSGTSTGVRVLGTRYRGRVLVHLNGRGTLNVINELSLEDYLRGVVPREMGPKIFDNLEALKAQTVAARTYTLRNLGEFGGEGYDICATPRCQVYGGMDVEHELTDQAIRETAGQVLAYGGELVDALYSSTCGGHTEDVQLVFPLKSQPYLKGVPCLEGGVDRLEGGAGPGARVESWIAGEVLPPGPGADPAALARRLDRLVELAGLEAAPEDRLASLDRREVQRYIGSRFDLALDARLFMAREDVAYLVSHPPARWQEEDVRLAAYLLRNGLLAGPLDEPLGADEIDSTLFQLALFLRVVEARPARYLGLGEGRLRARSEGEEVAWELPRRFGTFRQLSGRTAAEALRLVPGDRLTVYLRNGEPLAILQEADPDGVAFDRTSQLSSWTRFRSDSQLAELVRARYPGFELRGFELGARGVSGRVGELELVAADGHRETVRGLAIRWILDLPDTLFTAKRLTPAGREPGWLFSGRGWGHGVGLCQVGAYGMSVRGHPYQEILGHYYSGVTLERLETGAGPAG